MYVAMTRAREELYISRAKERFNFWDYVRNPESRFLKEIPKDHIIYYDMSEFTNSWNWNIFNNWNLSWSSEWFSFWSNTWWFNSKPKIKTQANNDVSQFTRWDKVSHPKFWNWIILSLNWELAEIAFSWKWTKKMNIRIAPVRKA